MRSNWTWAILGLLALGLRVLAGLFPELTDHYYSRILFPAIRNGIDHSLGYLPFPTVYLFIGLVVGIFVIFIRRFFRLEGGKKRGKYVLQASANGVG
ncbi:MAG: DUF3810 domain-containing protein, partial [Bacteroidetes bacterium]|nr:DUF3810 domain-containing protein [Bacteroidota bacterium]